jgi:hypothetical protein
MQILHHGNSAVRAGPVLRLRREFRNGREPAIKTSTAFTLSMLLNL